MFGLLTSSGKEMYTAIYILRFSYYSLLQVILHRLKKIEKKRKEGKWRMSVS
jgi:hypothetical protein